VRRARNVVGHLENHGGEAVSGYSVSWCPRVVGGKWNGGEGWGVITQPGSPLGAHGVHASCPTRDAAEAARRLLSGECARAKEEPPLPVCGVCSGGVCSEWCGYEAGKADGAAEERAKIVKWLTLHGQLSLAKFIERGEAGE